jgi:hypothetical protein
MLCQFKLYYFVSSYTYLLGCEGIKNFLFVSTLYYFKQEVTRYQENPLLPFYNKTKGMH